MSDVLTMPAGRELDVRIARKVMGLVPCSDPIGRCDAAKLGQCWGTGGAGSEVPCYSTRDEDALGLFRFLNEQGWNVSIRAAGIPPSKHVRVDVYCGRGPCELHGNEQHDWHGVEGVIADSLALALSRAAVFAVESARMQRVML